MLFIWDFQIILWFTVTSANPLFEISRYLSFSVYPKIYKCIKSLSLLLFFRLLILSSSFKISDGIIYFNQRNLFNLTSSDDISFKNLSKFKSMNLSVECFFCQYYLWSYTWAHLVLGKLSCYLCSLVVPGFAVKFSSILEKCENKNVWTSRRLNLQPQSHVLWWISGRFPWSGRDQELMSATLRELKCLWRSSVGDNRDDCEISNVWKRHPLTASGENGSEHRKRPYMVCEGGSECERPHPGWERQDDLITRKQRECGADSSRVYLQLAMCPF